MVSRDEIMRNLTARPEAPQQSKLKSQRRQRWTMPESTGKNNIMVSLGARIVYRYDILFLAGQSVEYSGDGRNIKV